VSRKGADCCALQREGIKSLFGSSVYDFAVALGKQSEKHDCFPQFGIRSKNLIITLELRGGE
jgi:hypothetical protein